jgi:hypothetical protein
MDQWTAAIAVDPQTGEVTTQRITPTPPSSSRFDQFTDPVVVDSIGAGHE